MKYNVLQFITNTQNQYSSKVSATFDTLKAAKVDFFGVARSLTNASDVLRAVVKIVDEYGNDIGYREVIENVPTPQLVVEETEE